MKSSPRSVRPFWGDVRFLIGIALVIASVASVWFIVSSARETSPVLQSARTIVVGEVLTSSDFRAVDVGLGALHADYLSPGELVTGLIATRTIEAGELVPRVATASADATRTTTLVIDSAAGISEAITKGTVVELWAAAPKEEGRGLEAPRILVPDVTVAGVVEAKGMVAHSSTSLEIVVDRRDVAAVLAAITDGSALSVVPVGNGR